MLKVFGGVLLQDVNLSASVERFLRAKLQLVTKEGIGAAVKRGLGRSSLDVR